MPRPSTAPERALAVSDYDIHHRFRTADADGDMIDLSSRFRALDARVGVDSGVMAGTVTLYRDGAAGSLAPLVDDGGLNVAGGSYAPLIDNARRFEYDTALVAKGAGRPADGSSAWKGIARGMYGDVRAAKPDMPLPWRDLSAFLQDRQVEAPTPFNEAGPQSLEDTLQDMLDALAPELGITLQVWTPSGVTLGPFEQAPDVSVWDAMNTLALRAGGNLRYRWQSDGSYQLTFAVPDRDKTTPDLTFSASHYLDVDELNMPLDTIRTRGELWYYDATVGEMRSVGPVEAPGPLAQYGVRFFRIVLDATSPVDTPEEALAMLSYAVRDLALPYATQVTPFPWLWMLDLDDLIEWVANGVHYTDAQQFAVVELGYSVDVEAAQDDQRRYGQVTVSSRGQPLGAYKRWLTLRGGIVLPPSAPPPDPTWHALVGELYPAGWDALADGRVWIRVGLGEHVQRVEFWKVQSTTTPVPMPTRSHGDWLFTAMRPDGVPEGPAALPPDLGGILALGRVNLVNALTLVSPASVGAVHDWQDFTPLERGLSCRILGVAYGYDGQKSPQWTDEITLAASGPAPDAIPVLATGTGVREGSGVRLDWTVAGGPVASSAPLRILVESPPGTVVLRVEQPDLTTAFVPDLLLTQAYTFYVRYQSTADGATAGQPFRIDVAPEDHASDDPAWVVGFPAMVTLPDGRRAARLRWTCTHPDLSFMRVEKLVSGAYRALGNAYLSPSAPFNTDPADGTADDTAGTSGSVYRLLAFDVDGIGLGYSPPATVP